MKKPLPTHRQETHDLAGVSVHSGFPNPAADSPLGNPDFNKLLVRHPVATYCMRIAGHAWEEQGIFDGDIAVIDRAISAHPQDLALWWQDESFVIGKQAKMPSRSTIWGVVTAIIHPTRVEGQK